jgi:hypothetical protein
MNDNSKNNYIRIPTQETERIKQVSNKRTDDNQKVISHIIKQLIIFNIISSTIVIFIIVTITVKLSDEKWETPKKLKIRNI